MRTLWSRLVGYVVSYTTQTTNNSLSDCVVSTVAAANQPFPFFLTVVSVGGVWLMKATKRLRRGK